MHLHLQKLGPVVDGAQACIATGSTPMGTEQLSPALIRRGVDRWRYQNRYRGGMFPVAVVWRLCVWAVSGGVGILLQPHGVLEKRCLVAQSLAELIGDMPG